MTTIFNFHLLGLFGQEMYETLLYKYHLSTNTPKYIEWKDSSYDEERGYELIKDNKRYILRLIDDDNVLDKLPIRIVSTSEMDTKDNKVVRLIEKYNSFNVTPVQTMTFKERIDIDRIIHKRQGDFTIWKTIHHSAKNTRINLRVSGPTEWGKTSYADADKDLDDNTKVIPKPGSLAGLSRGITPTGVLYLDEMGKLDSDARSMISTFLFQQGQFANVFVSGKLGSASHKTKAKYDIHGLSCINMYNNIEYYPKEKDFFDYAFGNSDAINTRFLPIRLPGMPFGMKPKEYKKKYGSMIPSEQFLGSKSMILTTEVKQQYYDVMRFDAWMKLNWRTLCDIDYLIHLMKKYSGINGRHLDSFLGIATHLYIYDKNNLETNLNKVYRWHNDYYDAMNPQYKEILEDEVETPFEVYEEKVIGLVCNCNKCNCDELVDTEGKVCDKCIIGEHK